MWAVILLVADVVGVPAAVVAALSLGTLSACGSDGESPEDAFCDAAVSLQTNIEGIADVDIISGGH